MYNYRYPYTCDNTYNDINDSDKNIDTTQGHLALQYARAMGCTVTAIRGNHLSDTTCLTHVFLKSGN